MKKISFTLLALTCIVFSAFAQHDATFENLTLAPNSYYDGSDLSGGFLSGDAYFYNFYDTAYGGYWADGFVYSDVKNDTTAGYTNEYASAADGGAFGSDNYAVAYTGGGAPVIALRGFAPGHPVYGFYVTNSTYAYLSMKNGDQFAKKFGGPTGTDPDWFRLTVKGYLNGNVVPDSVDVYLADFRSPDTTQHYILHSWQFVNLQSLGNVDSLFFLQYSSDTGAYGMNTPAYFCMDNFITTDGAPVVNTVAVTDTVSISSQDSVIIHILANDSVPALGSYTVSIVSGPDVTGAVAYLDSNNDLVYIPVIGVRVTDTVVYSLCNEFDSCSTAQVIISIDSGSVIDSSTVNGIHEANANSLTIYPNPAHSRITVSSTSAIESLSIVDMSGREVMAQSIGGHSSGMDISSLGAGIYTVFTHTSEGIAVHRLVKE
jgi:hypothetical protein